MEIKYDLNQGTGSMPVRWIVDDDDREQIRELGVSRAFVVIDVFYGEERFSPKQRLVVPAEQLLQFVSFQKPGDARVCVALVCPTEDSDHASARLRNNLLDKHSAEGSFSQQLFIFSDEDEVSIVNDWREHKHFTAVGFTDTSLLIPEEHFAKPLTGWMKWWVEWVPRNILRRSMIDDCDMRIWMGVAFTLQPPLFLGGTIVIGIIGIVFILVNACIAFYYGVYRGYRGINWPAVLKFDHGPDDMRLSVARADWSSRYKESVHEEELPFWRQLLQPATLLVLGSILLLIFRNDIIPNSDNSVIILAAAALFIAGAIQLVPVLFEGFFNLWNVSAKTEVVPETPEQQMRREKLLETLAHTADGAGEENYLTVGALPEKQRSLVLWYKSAKARVCHPLPS